MTSEIDTQADLAVVCGGGAVAAALADRLRRAGAAVIAIDSAGAAPRPDAARTLVGDLTAEADWERFAGEIRAGGLAPSMLAFAADASDTPALLDLPQGEWDRVVNHNLRAAYLACKHLFPLMRAPGAAVLAASTLADWDARADAGALAASGGGILALTRALALNGAPLGIRVNAVCYDAPLAADTPRARAVERIPLGRATAPDDVADAMMFFLSDDASYLTGSSLVVDGGQSLQSWSNAPA